MTVPPTDRWVARIESLLRGAVPPGPSREALLGDLEEAFQAHRARRGRALARLWYVGAALGVGWRYLALGSGFRGRFPGLALGSVLAPMCRAPRHHVAVAAMVVVGVASTGTVHLLVSAVLGAPPPGPAGERLVLVESTRGTDNAGSPVSYPDFSDWALTTRSYERVVAIGTLRLNIPLDDGSLPAVTESVTPGFFEMLGVEPSVGRLFSPRESAGIEGPVAVVSARLWERLGGGDLSRRRVVQAAEGSFEVVGVVPDFGGFLPIRCFVCDQVDAWVPTTAVPGSDADDLDDRSALNFRVLGALRPGTALAAANDEIRALTAEQSRRFPDTNADRSARVSRLSEQWRAGHRGGLWMLLAGAALLAGVAVVNVLLLCVARNRGRALEFATEAALGASRARLALRAALQTSVAVACGAVAGSALATGLASAYLTLNAARLPDIVSARMGPGPWLTMAGVCVLSGAIGALGTVRASRDPLVTLRGGGRTSSRVHTGRTVLVVQVAMVTALLLSAAVQGTSYIRLTAAPLGFASNDLHVTEVALASTRTTPEARRAFADQLLRALEARLGAGAYALVAPNVPPRTFLRQMVAPSPELMPTASRLVTEHRVEPGFLEMIGARLVAGRAFDRRDSAEAEPVAVISESLARVLSVEEPSVDRIWIETANGGAFVRVVGVVADLSYTGARSRRTAEYDLFLPLPQVPAGYISVAARGDFGFVSRQVAAAVHEVDGNATIVAAASVESRMAALLQQDWARASILSAFAAAALLLAVAGVYGVAALLAHDSARATATRLALGASPARVLQGAGRRLAGPAACGVLVGTLTAWVVTSWTRSVSADVAAIDSATAFVVAAVVGLSVTVASLIPLRSVLKDGTARLLRG